MVYSSTFEKIAIGDSIVNRIGLGTNRIRNDSVSKDALKKAVEIGVNFIDTASAYTGGLSEKTIGETLTPYKNIFIATKGGMVAPDFRVDARPETLRIQLDASLEKLKLQTIPLYFLHRVDPNVPMKDSLLFLKQMQQEGKIKYIGLSQVTIKQIEEARKYVDIVAIENEYNLSERTYDDVVTYAEKEKIAFIPFFPIHFVESDFLALQELQKKYNATTTQIALCWLLKRSPVMLPIPGSLSAVHLRENIGALKIKLSDEDFRKL